jgi:hypothetical protein
MIDLSRGRDYYDLPVRPVKFPLGLMLMTPGASDKIPRSKMAQVLRGHVNGDWGDLEDGIRQANDRAIKEVGRLPSAYHTKSEVTFWIITTADRKITSVLLSKKY